MTEYIYKGDALFALSALPLTLDAETTQRAIEAVRHVPAADVVEVVRCKDCKHSYDSIGGWCCSHGVCVDCIVPEDFFCKDGERKEGEG